MRYRSSYAADPALADRVFDLLDLAFPDVPVSASRRGAEQFGATWESVSTPFVRRSGGSVVSHVGLLSLPLTIQGSRSIVGGIHGVATHPDHRREGHFRALMDELLAYTLERFDTLVLTTVHPEYFEPFGFRVVPESVFRARVERSPSPPDVRQLELAKLEDRALMRQLLEERAPVSNVLGVGPEKAVWAFYEAGSHLRYSPGLDLVIVAEQIGGFLRIYDLVGSSIPPVEQVVAALGDDSNVVLTFFAPDRLGATFEAERHDLQGGPDSLEAGTVNTQLMVRGPLAAEGAALMLPRPARC
jgi:predicted N-acetyltransferase YhbS